MPYSPKSPCKIPTCPKLAYKWGYCREHSKQFDEQRGTAAERGYDSRWVKARKMWLAEHPLCVACEKEGRVTGATVVDHIQRHKGDRAKFWDSESNWQSLCDPCHRVKTVNEVFRGMTNEFVE